MNIENNQNYINQPLDDALRLMERSGEESQADVERMMGNEECAASCRQLWMLKNSLERHSADVPDVDAEWTKFIQGKRRRKRGRRMFVWGVMSGVAASLLVVVAFALWQRLTEGEYVAYESRQVPVAVTLQSSGQDSIVLGRKSDARLSGLSGHVSRTDSSLVYGKGAKASEPVQKHVLSTSRGTTFKVELSDGTIVWLNANSSLAYASRFEGRERRVTLQGEAYFQVARNEQMPFVVETNSVTTKVLGTEFNMRTATEADAASVTLVKGSVDVLANGSSRAVRLKPGENAAIDSDGTITTEYVDTDVYSYWKEGFFYFDNTRLIDVMKSLGEWYDMNVVFRRHRAMDYRMHYFCNRNGSIREALEQLNGIGKAKAVIVGRTIYVE